MAIFIKVTIIEDDKQIISIVNLDEIHSFAIVDDKLQMRYKQLDENGGNYHHVLKETPKEIADKLASRDLILK